MTTPNGLILFNNSTGSDTQASGLGPSTAVFGSGASTTGSSAVVTGIDTTGVTAGDLLWVQSSSGRQFSIIASVDSGSQVTCDDTFANTESDRDWAVGGKRSTLDGSFNLFSSRPSEKISILLETNQTISQSLTVGNSISVYGSDPENHRVLLQTANENCFSLNGSGPVVSGLWLQNSHPSSGTGIGGIGTRGVSVYNCLFGSDSNPLTTAINPFGSRSSVYGCLFLNISTVYNSGGLGNSLEMVNCYTQNCDFSPSGVLVSNSSFVNCIFFGMSSGISFSDQGRTHTFSACMFIRADSSAVIVPPSPAVRFSNCLFMENAGYAIEASNTENIFGENNYTFMNTSGVVEGGASTLFQSSELSTDPLQDADAGNLNLNDEVGGGAVLRTYSIALS